MYSGVLFLLVYVGYYAMERFLVVMNSIFSLSRLFLFRLSFSFFLRMLWFSLFFAQDSLSSFVDVDVFVGDAFLVERFVEGRCAYLFFSFFCRAVYCLVSHVVSVAVCFVLSFFW